MRALVDLWRRLWFGMWQTDYAFKPVTTVDGTVIDQQWVLRRWHAGRWEYRALSLEDQADAHMQWCIK